MRTTKKALQFLAEVFETDVYTMSLIYPEYNWRKRGNVLPVVTNTQEHHVIQTRSIQALNSLLHAEEAIPDTLRERALAKIEDLDITVSPRTMCTTVTMSHGAKYKSKILTAQESNIVHQIGYKYRLEDDDDSIQLTPPQGMALTNSAITACAVLIASVALIKHLKISENKINDR